MSGQNFKVDVMKDQSVVVSPASEVSKALPSPVRYELWRQLPVKKPVHVEGQPIPPMPDHKNKWERIAINLPGVNVAREVALAVDLEGVPVQFQIEDGKIKEIEES